MIVCVPVTGEGLIDPRWGRANRVAVAEIAGGEIVAWEEFDVQWGDLHNAGTEGAHHARVARFLRENHVETVLAHHMGEDMANMLERLGIQLRLGAGGSAREAVKLGAP
jgi:predicted Fe-Mo cluster-binding NifX family protein